MGEKGKEKKLIKLQHFIESSLAIPLKSSHDFFTSPQKQRQIFVEDFAVLPN